MEEKKIGIGVIGLGMGRSSSCATVVLSHFLNYRSYTPE
jgi:hypothetical protein